ncbi:MAG: hypothetical protein KDA21_09795 [Phycisphaerales bacterium]|nr:hypothetical protein [Phycisphaerales bacterium]
MPADIPVIGPVINKIFGTRNERFVRRYTTRVEAIGAKEPEMRQLSDADLRARTAALRERFEKEGRASDLLVDAFAVAREVMDRSVGIRNIFNPKLRDRFPLDRLAASDRALYDETLAKMEATPDAPPLDDFLGCTDVQPGWLQVEIPARLYEAVRELFPESRPPFRARPFDMQLIGGMVLY